MRNCCNPGPAPWRGMGRLSPFRRSGRRRNWSRAGAYGAVGAGRSASPRGLGRGLLRWLVNLRPFFLGGVLLSIWPAVDPALIEPPGFLSTEPERVAEPFSRCGPGRAHACVIDGDTIKIGPRKIRIIGIDAPETHPARCPEEARAGEAATAELQRLLNQGPYTMTGRIGDGHDRYAATCARSAGRGPTARPSRSPRICARAGMCGGIWGIRRGGVRGFDQSGTLVEGRVRCGGVRRRRFRHNEDSPSLKIDVTLVVARDSRKLGVGNG